VFADAGAFRSGRNFAARIGLTPKRSLGECKPKPQIPVALAVPFDARVRGLMNIFSFGMDTLAEKIQRHGI
jgi:hypothetical protein